MGSPTNPSGPLIQIQIFKWTWPKNYSSKIFQQVKLLLKGSTLWDNIYTIEPRDSQIGGAAKIIWLYRGLVITGLSKKSIYLMKSNKFVSFDVIDFV